MIRLEDLDICKEYHLLSNNLIKIYNPKTGHFTFTRSVFDIPEGYCIVQRRPFTEQSRKKMSESARKRGTPNCAFRNKNGKNNPMYGKKQSDETKKKISESLKRHNKEKKKDI